MILGGKGQVESNPAKADEPESASLSVTETTGCSPTD